jgi:amidophosphoribosyltransferase
MCGVIGVYGAPEASKEVYYGMLTLQHRGQDAAGILTYQFAAEKFQLAKNPGTLAVALKEEDIAPLRGEMAIGHTRYSTVGSGDKSDIQPFLATFPYGIGMVHNGNVLNGHQLRQDLQEKEHRYCVSQNDLEVLLNIVSGKLAQNITENQTSLSFEHLAEAVQAVYEKAIGGYSVVGMVGKNGLFAFRDQHGIRPLVLGMRSLSADELAANELAGVNVGSKSYILASESKTLDFLGYQLVRDIAPGELIYISQGGVTEFAVIHRKVGKEILPLPKKTPCMFEWVYFAGTESVMDERSVYDVRLNLGKGLGHKIQMMIDEGIIAPDVVAPVPDTSRTSALALSEAIGVPYREVLIKNRYIQRSFILNDDKQRKKAVSLKFGTVGNQIKGKNLLLVDDSIVRGTTAKKLIELLRNAGAKNVYFVSACPPIVNPCFYGIDFPDAKELIAESQSTEEMQKYLGADKVIFLDKQDLYDAIDLPGICAACVDGKYPTNIEAGLSFAENRKVQRKM